MRIAFYRNAQDRDPRVEDLSWQQLVELLTKHDTRDDKNGPAWSPVEIQGTRKSENVKAITAAVFDLDHLSEQQATIFEALEKSGHGFIVHSSFSHEPPDNCAFRVVFPLSRSIRPAEWPVFREAVIRRFSLPADPATKDPSRIYFLPTARAGTSPVAEHVQGNPLDVESLLAERKAGAASPATAIEIPPDDPNTPVDQLEIRKQIRRSKKPEHQELVRRVLAGEGLGPRGAENAFGGQDNALSLLCSAIAFCVDLTIPDEAILELMRPTLAATDWGEGTEHLIEQARQKLRAKRHRRFERDRKQAEERARLLALLGKKTVAPAPESPPQEEDAPAPDDWMKRLRFVLNASGEPTGKLINDETNLGLVLTHAPEWRGVLRFDALTKDIVFDGAPTTSRTLEILPLDIVCWFQTAGWADLGLKPKKLAVIDAIQQVATKNSFNPLVDYLTALRWDNARRLGRPLADALRLARAVEGNDIGEYVDAVVEKFMLGAVARALEPGCKFDTVLILEGNQGIGKSTALSILGGKWFTDAPIIVTNKDSAMLASQNWIIELAEVNALVRSESSAQKAFFSTQEDNYRPPYGRTTVKTPRSCVFVGTTNETGYLRDATGNRRYWPVRCSGPIDLSWLRQNRDQLWAEAVARYWSGERTWLSDELRALADAQAEKRVERAERHSVRAEMLVDWLLKKPPEQRPRALSMREVLEQGMGIGGDRIDRAAELAAGRALRELGFDRRLRGKPARNMWITPAALLEQPQEIAPTKTIAQQVAGAKAAQAVA